ncbi:winged helix DNA-binding domain-containing protein [Asanoa sp. WMMD1127]|uniref:winged helix DNA-binding domain-containing protein n=1 Tax=Asanoa sp. WMMD1127 TaxID=3016107 RepID=UPI0024174A93|nr:winged helix DNA-binding domain-containing protein [Asanoa sp. WMMD1127]MDG4826099.1 winged helix DNA-binding domain-containing protein [Asanoa sp. WMMD1127]
MTRHIDVTEHRARLAVRHRLAGPSAHDPVEVTRDLVVLHATDAATVYLGAAARMHAPVIKDIEHALYADRTLIRMLGMRRTMFIAPVEHAPIVQAACTDAIAVVQRKLLLKHLAEAGHDYGDDWLRDVEQGTLAALRSRGSATAAQLAADEPRLRTLLSIDEDKSYGAKPAITSRVLNLLSMQGLIVRGRPRGTWLSTQYEWAPAEAWVEGGLHRHDAPTARAELARLWLARFGPGTPADLKWWTGWTGAQTKAALAALDVETVTLDGGETGVVLASDIAPVEAPEPWVALLPALDPTIMGWVGREWYLGPHAPALFDRSGNPGPTVWVNGRVVGGWTQRPDGRVVHRLLEEVPAATAKRITAAAGELEDWLGDARVKPKFRTPLEKELAG